MYLTDFLYNICTDVYTIEFQKRGLPHCHILLWLEPLEKHNTSEFVDRIISAEIPDKVADQKCYELVTQFMIHGPCGEENKGAPCMIGETCTKKFPKSYHNETTIDENGKVVYKRRNNGR